MVPKLSIKKLGSGSEGYFELIAIISTNLFQKGLLIYPQIFKMLFTISQESISSQSAFFVFT